MRWFWEHGEGVTLTVICALVLGAWGRSDVPHMDRAAERRRCKVTRTFMERVISMITLIFRHVHSMDICEYIPVAQLVQGGKNNKGLFPRGHRH